MKKIISGFNHSRSEELKVNFLKRAPLVFESGQFVFGQYSEALCSSVSLHLDDTPSVLFNSGSSALECLFEYLAKEARAEVVAVQSNTNFATVSAILRAGLKVVYVECDEYGQLCYLDLKSKVARFSIDVVSLVHIGGYASRDLERITQFCSTNHIVLVEDAAHAHGCQFNGKKLGTFGAASVFSYFATKIVQGGEGGSLNSRDADIIEFAKSWVNQGKTENFGSDHKILGSGRRISEFSALLALISYEFLDSEIELRRSIAEVLERTISTLPIIKSAPFGHQDKANFYKYIIVPESSKISEFLAGELRKHGVHCTGKVYGKACHMQDAFRGHTGILNPGRMRVTEEFCSRHLCLPVHSAMSDSVEYLSEVLNLVVSQK